MTKGEQKSNPKVTQSEEGSLLTETMDSGDDQPKTALQRTKSSPKKIQFTEVPCESSSTTELESSTMNKKLQRKKSNSKMIQFTESISAINSMSATLGVIIF